MRKKYTKRTQNTKDLENITTSDTHERHPGSVWLTKNWDRVQEQYGGQWVAVNGKGVAAAANSPETLEREFAIRHPDRDYSPMMAALVPPKPAI